jgi:hypothetical protein
MLLLNAIKRRPPDDAKKLCSVHLLTENLWKTRYKRTPQ